MRAREFELLGRMVERVPLRQVIGHQEPAYLPRLCQVILKDLQARTTSAAAPTVERLN